MELSLGGSRFTLTSSDGSRTLEMPLAGRFNVANAAVAAGCAGALGIDDDAIRAGVASVERVPGRFELVAMSGNFTVVVDYAHTPDGIVAVIDAAREILSGSSRVIAVVGAGGNRDRAKRPPDGQCRLPSRCGGAHQRQPPR